MDAERTLGLWRRILRDEAFRQAVFEASDPLAEAGFELSPEQREMAAAFRAHARAAYWPVQGYRFRLTQEYEAAVTFCAPLTAAVLSAHGHDLSEIAERFGSSIHWHDYGRHMGHAARDLLVFVADGWAGQIAGLHDVIALETTKLELLARLADMPVGDWAAPKHVEPLNETVRYRCSPAAALVHIERDLSPWFEAPDRAAEVVPASRPGHFAVYVESLDIPVQYAGLSDDAATVFGALHEPLALAEVAARVGSPPLIRRARHAMKALVDIGMIRPAELAGAPESPR